MQRLLGAAAVEVTARRAAHHLGGPVIRFVRQGAQWGYHYLWDTRYPQLRPGYDTCARTMHVEVTVRCAPGYVHQVEHLLVTPSPLGQVGVHQGVHRLWHGGLQQIPGEWI